MRTRHRHRGLRGWLAAAATLILSTVFLGSPPANASYGNSIHMGWDACATTIAKAQAFWTNTPYWNMGLYIGGSSYGSGCKRWSASEVSQLRTMGYKFLPLWVGPQAPCTSYGSRFSATASTAYTQGRDQAVAAFNAMGALGMDTLQAPIIYDLEAYDTANSGCLSAARSFINGWVYQLHVAPAQRAGVYGSTCGSGLDHFATLANVPDFIFGANWNGNKSTSNMSCIASTHWTNRQRHKQYQGDHNETWNGVTMNIDSDCSNGPVYPAPDALTNPQGCE